MMRWYRGRGRRGEDLVTASEVACSRAAGRLVGWSIRLGQGLVLAALLALLLWMLCR